MVLIIVQAVFFNNLILFNSAIALVTVYFIIQLPITISTNWMMTIGFALGLSVDIFQDTAGLCALTCTLTAFVRRGVFHLYAPRDEDFAGRKLSIVSMGVATYLKYALTMVVIYCTLYFAIESLTYMDIGRLATRILASSVFTFIVIYAFDALTVREKRL